jgi:hypothetical protein
MTGKLPFYAYWTASSPNTIFIDMDYMMEVHCCEHGIDYATVPIKYKRIVEDKALRELRALTQVSEKFGEISPTVRYHPRNI